MGYVVSFDGYTPPARFDAVPWENAQIYEAASPSATGTLIDTVSLGASDPDPAQPRARDITTTLGTAPDLWYWLVFVDGALNVSEPTTAKQNTETATSGDPACQEWITGSDVLDCCDATLGSEIPVDTFASEATALLYELSGRRFSGICQRTVRPCPGHCGCWPGGTDPLSRYFGTSIDGELVGGGAWFDGGYWWFGRGGRRGCMPLSTVKLAGYPVSEIVEVLIDDAVVDPAGYELRNGRDLVRLNDADGKHQRWPGCQDTGKPSGAGTFFVTYRYGVAPPAAGVEAAKQLACQLAKACPSGGGSAGEDCDLPPGTVRVTRQGLTIEAQTLGLYLKSGTTGLAHVDAFLSVYSEFSKRPATVWSPEVQSYAQEA